MPRSPDATLKTASDYEPVKSNSDPRIPFLQRAARVVHLEISEVWVRFLLALVGLILAFGAALFSTAARDSGNLWATVILASIALVLAVVVGLTTVPYLAKRVAASQIRDALDYEVTRVGVIYVTVLLLIGIAALNTGNNLLYIIVAAMLAAVLASGFASAAVLRGVELDVRLPEHVFAAQPMLARIALKNRRTWLPSFSLNVVSFNRKTVKSWRWMPSTFSLPPWRKGGQQWLQLPDRRLRRIAKDQGPPVIFHGSAYFPYLPPKTELIADLELNFEKRGRYQQEGFGLATRFPFAFLTKTRRIPLAREIIVYPPVAATTDLLEVLPMIRGEFETYSRGRGSDLYRIREYMPEDSARHVDWKATAKSGSLKVREFSREDERKLRIVFDNPEVGQVSTKDYERAVNLAASLTWHFTDDCTRLSFLSQQYSGVPDIYEYLNYLALVKPCLSPSALENLQPSEDFNVIVTARKPGTIPAVLWECSYLFFIRT